MSIDVTESEQLSQGTNDDVVLEVRDVKKYFPLTQGIVFKRTVGHVKAVDGVSFELKKGETLGVVGESGCGKSTLGRLLMGLERPTDGSIKLLGEEMAGLSPRAMRRMRRNIQIVLQDPYSSLDP
ncbi:MAG: ATP-binding cassette domain-containing protein, partial [Nocardioidaceae bacterium]